MQESFTQEFEPEFQIEVGVEVKKETSKRATIEKLDGGYISDVGGKRKIYKNTNEIIDEIGVEKLFKDLEHNEYKLVLDLVPIKEYHDYVDLLEVYDREKNNKLISLDQAKESGLIEIEKFNPNKVIEKEPEKEIKITKANCYTINRLKSIDWKSFDEQLSLNNTERAEICGITPSAMFPIWKNAITGKAKYTFAETRIRMTVLAKYYEKNLSIRTCSKEKTELLKETVLKNIRDLEVLCSEQKSHIKISEVLKTISTIRKTLLKE